MRGLLWHSALVLYYVQVYVEPDVYEMRQETMYINHINVLDNQQDGACFVILIESILNFIKMVLTYITRVILQSDN